MLTHMYVNSNHFGSTTLRLGCLAALGPPSRPAVRIDQRRLMRKLLKRGATKIAAGAVATGLLCSSMTPAVAADEPWRDATKSPTERATALLNALSFDEKVQVALDNFQPLVKYGLPPILASHDGPSGVSIDGATAFPAAQALAASFDRDLAARYGTAIAQEIRDSGRSIWLGPSTDVTRQPLSGRQAENLGEDPYLIGTTARAEVDGAKSQNVMTTVKHYGANTQEYGRMGFESDNPDDYFGRTPAINENIPLQALQEIYEAPVVATTKGDGADSVMCAYNQVNGLPACQNPELLNDIKSTFQGLVIPDYLLGQRDAVLAALAGVDIAGFDGGNQQRTAAMYTSGEIPLDILDKSDHRIFYALFNSGVYDHPPVTQAEISTAAHKQLAAQVAAQGMVLLKNAGDALPLNALNDKSVAVIGPSGMDAMYVEGGGPAVPVSADSTVTPLAGITVRAGTGTTIVPSQGSAGDVAATDLVSGAALKPTSGDGTGWSAQYWDTPAPQGTPAISRNEASINVPNVPTGLKAPYSAKWTSTFTPPETGLYRFTSLVSGDMTFSVNGQTVIDAKKPTSWLFRGPQYPAQGTISLKAGEPVRLSVGYSSVSTAFGNNGINLAWQTPSQSGIPAAVAVAKKAKVAIVMANFAAGEGADRDGLDLPGDQNQLIEAVAKANPRTIVVLNTAGPVLMPWLDKVEGVVQAWYPGQTFGTALAKVLYGDVNPSGHLPVTFPASESQGPVAATPDALTGENGSLNFDEGIHVGYRWYDKTGQTPLFPFGYGLSYTSFRYSDLTVRPDSTGANVSVRVRNVGSRTGSATPQFYVGAPTGRYDAQFAKYALGGYGKITLRPGQTGVVSVHIDSDQLNYWDTAGKSWKSAPIGRTVSVGDSVRNIMATAPLVCGRR
ncbi:glycoside hydrolase family 3 C-terminal domain-containing protein [Streptomyces mirabilis]|nr:glycoside hydrolase family 3 C-terminal domain-containing protein [Streptomyces mirabilis]